MTLPLLPKDKRRQIRLLKRFSKKRRHSLLKTEKEFELPVVSPPAPPPVGTWSPESYEYDDYAKEISMSVFDAENQIQN